MLDDLLQKGIIELPPSKCIEEAGKTNDPKYCPYHRVIIHPLEKYIRLKERTMQLINGRAIIIDLDKTAETNCIIIWYEHCQSAHSLIEELVAI